MKCLFCGSFYHEKRYSCPNCGSIEDIMKKAHRRFNNIAFTDEKMRIVVTGLWLWGVDTSMSDEGGKGHAKPYPWIELGFPPDSDAMQTLKVILHAYHATKRDYEEEWVIERQIGGCHWLVPKDKSLPIKKLHENLSRFGWFLHQKR